MNAHIFDLVGVSGYLAPMAQQWTFVGLYNSSQPAQIFCIDTWYLTGPGLINPYGYMKRTYSPLRPHQTIFYSMVLLSFLGLAVFSFMVEILVTHV